MSQPIIPSRFPELPWQKVGMDLFEWRKRGDVVLFVMSL